MESYLKNSRIMDTEANDEECIDAEPPLNEEHENEFINDSGIGRDESLELIRQLREELSQARKDKEDQAKFFTQELADQELRLTRALRGNIASEDYGAERTILLLDQKLKGKKIIPEEEFVKFKEWEENRKVEESALNILKESESGLTKILEGYNKV